MDRIDRFLNHEIPTDILQEALPNVVAAHVMQSYIGGYGILIIFITTYRIKVVVQHKLI